jgi:hypothetical protein
MDDGGRFRIGSETLEQCDHLFIVWVYSSGAIRLRRIIDGCTKLRIKRLDRARYLVNAGFRLRYAKNRK